MYWKAGILAAPRLSIKHRILVQLYFQNICQLRMKLTQSSLFIIQTELWAYHLWQLAYTEICTFKKFFF